MQFDVNDVLKELVQDKPEIDINPNEVLEELLEVEVEVETEVEEEVIEEQTDDEVDYGDEEFIIEDDGDSIFEPKKPTKEEREQHAWAEMRKENKEKQRELDRLNDIAVGYGFKNHSEMLEKLEEDRMIKEAKTRGQDPEVFKQINSMENKIKQLESERAKQLEAEKAKDLLNKIDNFVKTNGLPETDRQVLIEKLDEDGFSVDDLSKIRNVNALFSGYVNESMNEKEVQKRLKQERERKSLEENKFKGTGAETEFSLDDLMEATIKRATGTKY